MDNAQQSVLQKLLRRPSAVVALCIIGLTCLVSVFAYVAAPDDTPAGNRMIIELGARQAVAAYTRQYPPATQ